MNYLRKLCETCGAEFEISKFQPYIVQCKKCRKSKTVKTVIKKAVKSKEKMAKACCREAMVEMDGMGLIACTCGEQFWHLTGKLFRSYFRNSEGKFVAYIDGKEAGKFASIKEMVGELL